MSTLPDGAGRPLISRTCDTDKPGSVACASASATASLPDDTALVSELEAVQAAKDGTVFGCDLEISQVSELLQPGVTDVLQ